MTLSKSDYMLSLKHPAWLWLKKYDKQRLPEVDENTQAVFDAGNVFESYAEKLFADGIRLGFTDYQSYLSLPNKTMSALLGGATTIFQARFEAEGLTCITDVIQVVGEKTFDLYEIKSSTQVKTDHLADLAFQVHVLQKSGFSVRNVFVVHVNNEYVREGNLDPQQLCTTEDVTSEVFAIQGETVIHIQTALEILQSSSIPDMSPSLAANGAFGEWLEIFLSINPQPEDSIYKLATLNAKTVKQLEESGIRSIADIPDDFPLTAKQQKQVEATKLNSALIEEESIRNFMKDLEYPLYFLDYETLASVVPPFDGTKSYQQIPFQYSLHVIDSPDSQLRHLEFLHTRATNPMQDISESLRKHIGDSGTVLAWNMGFEKSCNSLLAENTPHLADFLLDLNERMNDLMIPFSKLWYVRKEFCGSASIKKVLPVIVPELSYTNLHIKDGASAQRLWMQAVVDGKDVIDRELLFTSLLEYCKLDTLAMVEIYNVLRKI
jgi:hypothetical protein